MKRNELLAKSLTLGLAVATAATSMSVPGGLLTPETVYAADESGTTESNVKLSSDNVATYFALSDQPIVAVTLNESTVTKVNGPLVNCVKEGTGVIDEKSYGKLTITFKDSTDKDDVEKNNLEVGKEYNVYINVDGKGTVLAAADQPVKLGKVTVYEDLGDNAILTYKDGADDKTGVTDLTNKEFKNDVGISVSDGATISTSSTVGSNTSVTIPRGNIVSGSLPVALYVKKDNTTYAKIVTLNFAQKAAPSEMTGTASITTEKDGAISKLVIGDTVKAKYEGSDAKSLKYQWYRVPAAGDEAVKIEGATEASYTLTADDKGCKMKVVISDATLSGSKEATTEAVVKMKGVNLETAKVTLNDAADKNEFTYTGTSVITSVKVASGETTLEESKYKVCYTNSTATEAGTNTVAPTAVGDYKLWIVPASEDSEDCYGSKSVDFSIKAITVDETNKNSYIEYAGLQNLTLTYNGEDQWDNIFAVISSKNTKLVPEDELDVVFKKQNDSSQKNYLDDIVDAGTYDVYVGIYLDNIKTTEPVQIGTVTVDPHQTDASAIKVVGNESTYYGGTVLHKNVDVTDSLMQGQLVTLTYKQVKDGNGNDVVKEASEAAPVNAGTYDIYAAYTKDPNCTALDATKTGAQIVITKADKKVTAGQLVVNKDATEEQSIDLTAIVDKLTCTGVDQTIKANVTSDDDYFTADGLKYEGGVIKVKLDTAKTNNLPDNTKATIHVDFKNSFNNYKVAFDIPVVITTKKVANITIANATNGILGTYGKVPKQLTFTISGVENLDLTKKTDAEIKSACLEKYGDSNWAFGCTIHNQNGEEVKSIENAGTYSVHVTYWDSKCYGEITDVIVVKPKEIGQTSDFGGILSLGTASLAYNFENQYDAIKKLVQLDAKDGVGSGDYEVVIKKGDSETEDASDAGSYGVYIAFNHGNYTTSGKLVQLGTVDIAKNKDAITLDVAKDGTPIVKVGSRTIPNKELQQILYVDESGAESGVKPTAAGKYKVKVSYTNSNLENKLEGAVKEFTITSGGSSGNTSVVSPSGGSSAGGGAATTPSKDDTKKDDTKKDTTTKTETKPDGTKVTTTETKAADGSVQTKIELKNDTAGVDATVNVAKDAQGKVTGVTADVNQTATDKQTAISAATVAQITAAAGTKDVAITTKTVDANGKTVREVTVNASDLTAGKKLKVVAVDPKTGEKTLVNKTTYKVAADGSLALDNLGNDSYEVVTTAEVNALTKEILQSIRPERSKANIAAGKKTKLSLDDALNMDNVAKITYKTSKKSVATVNPNGTVTARKEGKVTIKAIVTLNNGKKKTVRMNLTVKARK